jgi:hypothetical protein
VVEVPTGLDSDALPALCRACDARSNQAQRNVLRAVKVSLGGAIVAALLGPFEIMAGDVNVAALGAAVSFLLSLLASSWLLWKRPERTWYDARAGAESTKTLAWQFAVGGGEFARSEAEEEVQRRFLNRLGEVLEGLNSVGTAVGASDPQLTPPMLKLRAAPLGARQDAYREGRIGDQRSWYAAKAAWNERQRKIWALVTVAMQVLGLAAGTARAFWGLDVDLLGIAAAAVGAGTAWTRTKDYAELAEAYAVTAQEIGILAAEPVPADEENWSAYVDGAERAFSREHTLWRARKGQSPIG